MNLKSTLLIFTTLAPLMATLAQSKAARNEHESLWSGGDVATQQIKQRRKLQYYDYWYYDAYYGHDYRDGYFYSIEGDGNHDLGLDYIGGRDNADWHEADG